jgi:hypothetical protein
MSILDLLLMLSPLLIFVEMKVYKRDLLRRSSVIGGYKVYLGTQDEYIAEQMMNAYKNRGKSRISSVFTETKYSQSSVASVSHF